MRAGEEDIEVLRVTCNDVTEHSFGMGPVPCARGTLIIAVARTPIRVLYKAP